MVNNKKSPWLRDFFDATNGTTKGVHIRVNILELDQSTHLH